MSLNNINSGTMSNSNNPQTTIIGESCRLTGDLTISGNAIVHGAFEGDLQIDGSLAIGASGSFKGNARARTLGLGGRLEGDIVCEESLTLEASSSLTGNVFATRFAAEEGATCNAHVVIGPDAVASADRNGANRSTIGRTTSSNPLSPTNTGSHAEEAEPATIGATVGRIDSTGKVAARPNPVSGLLRRRSSLLGPAVNTGT